MLDLAPATAAPATVTFTDPDGDVVTIRLRGSAGVVQITSDESVTANGLLDNGEEIVSIAIVNPSANFILSFSSDSSAGGQGVFLGDITANKVMSSITTTRDATNGTTFDLGSFKGTNLNAGGSINVDNIIGDVNGVALVLNQGLAARSVINVRADLTGDVNIGTTAAHVYAGSINVGGDVVAGSIWTISGNVNAGALVTVGDEFDSDVDVKGTFNGLATIGGDASGVWTLRGDVGTRARLSANSWADVNALKNFGGALLSGTTASIDVSGNLLGSAALSTVEDLTLNIGGNVLANANVHSGGSSLFDIVGSFLGGRFSVDNDLTMTVGGSINGGSIVSNDSGIDIDVAGSITNVKITGESDLDLTVGGAMVRVNAFAGNSDITLDVAGTITDSTFVAGGGITATTGGTVTNTTFSATEDASTIDITGNLVNSKISSGSSLVEVIVSGSVVKTIMQSLEDQDLSVSIGGSISDSRLTSADDVTLDVGAAATNLKVTSSGASISADIGGTLTGSTFTAHDGIEVTVDGNVLNSRLNAGSTDLSVSIGGSVTNSNLTAWDSIEGSIGGTVTNSYLESIDGDILLPIGASILNSTISAHTEISLDVTGGVTNSDLVVTDGSLTLLTGGAVAGTHISAQDEVSMDIGGSILNTQVINDSTDMTIEVGGDVVNSLFHCGSSDLSMDIAGNVLNSKFIASESGVTLTVGGSFTDSLVQASDSTATIDIGGNLVRSHISNGDELLSLTVGGSVTDSEISSSSIISADVTGNVSGSKFVASETDVTLSIGGSILAGARATIIQAREDVVLAVTGSATNVNVQAGADAVVIIDGSLSGFVQADRIDLVVGVDVSATSDIQARTAIVDIDGDTLGFSVGRDFLGTLDTVDFSTGTGASVTVVGRDVGQLAKININTIDEGASADEFIFGGQFRGELNLLEDLDVDLSFAKDVAQVTIGGQVNSTITVGGKLTFLTSNSLFDPADAFDGDFVDGLGTATGNLDTTGGFVTVEPQS